MATMGIEEKSQMILKLVNEIIEEAQTVEFRNKSKQHENISGMMRTFGSEYIMRMTTFSKFFKGLE
jgi:hypothetical protein